MSRQQQPRNRRRRARGREEGGQNHGGQNHPGGFGFPQFFQNFRHSFDNMVHDFSNIAEGAARRIPTPHQHQQQQQQQPQQNPFSSQPAPPASARAIRQLPTIRVAPEDLVDPNNRECCICLEECVLYGSRVFAFSLADSDTQVFFFLPFPLFSFVETNWETW